MIALFSARFFPRLSVTLSALLRAHRLRTAGLALLALSALRLPAQTDPVIPGKESLYLATPTEDVSGGGRFYWVIFREPGAEETEDTGWSIEDAVVARGIMYADGIDSIILAPETRYRMWAVYAENLRVGYKSFMTPRSGERFQIPRMGFYSFVDDVDDDLDQLGQIAEFIIGTNENNPDTDGDGVDDGAEVLQGLNPIDGLIAATGIVGSAPCPGPAVDICAANNIVIVACGTAGVAIFNVEASDSPTRIGQVDTPGNAQAVACFGTLLAVADGSAGLTVIDLADPPAARIMATVPMPADVVAVSTLGNFAFAGLSNGQVIAVDMFTGEQLDRKSEVMNYGAIQDVGVVGSFLYVLQIGRLSVFEVIDGELEFVSGTSAPGGVGAGRRRLRLFLGKDFALSTFLSGYNVFDLSNLTAPARVGDFTNTQRGWKQMLSNGDGVGLAVASPNSTDDGPHHVSLYDLRSGLLNAAFQTEYPTPGLAAAGTLYNGLLYVADSNEGLQVVNYLAFDNQGVPPTIAMQVDAPNDEVEEGKVAVVEVDVTDDVQVRNVTFFIDGEPVYTDGNYPYSFNLIAPLISETATGTFVIHAQAIDTGGNVAQSAPLLLTLVPDNTPPRVRYFSPKSGSFVGSIQAIAVAFNELMDPATLRPSSMTLREAGGDGLLGTSDDLALPVAISYEEATMRALFDPGSPLPPGLYQAAVRAPAADLAGNLIERTYTSTFRVFSFVDSDRDGVPDGVETDLGLDPNNPDSDGDGIPDGLEDFDGDGLPLAGEIFLGTDPTLKDTDGNGIDDGDEDSDFDGLTDGEEIYAGTDPTKIDSDGDGIDDPTEIAAGFDPNDPGNRWNLEVASSSVAYINAIVANAGEILSLSIASPVVSYVNGIVQPSEVGGGTLSIASPVASYINGIVGPGDFGPGGQVISVASPVASYLNGLLGSDTGVLSITSPIVSYDNN